MSSHDVVFSSDEAGARGLEITSSIILDRLKRGDVQGAAVLLGRPWSIEGVVVHGDKRGRLLGFATANLILDDDRLLAQGVYTVRAIVNGTAYDAVACYGTRPQFDNGAPRLEVHILDFNEDIYGASLVVEFIGFQRPEERFTSVETLKMQMTQDCVKARQVLRGNSYANGLLNA